jgi:hypothetical protein
MKIGDCMLGFMSLPDSKWLSSKRSFPTVLSLVGHSV